LVVVCPFIGQIFSRIIGSKIATMLEKIHIDDPMCKNVDASVTAEAR